VSVQKKTFEEVDKLVGDPKTKKHNEAIVFIGTGGDLNEWVDGITGMLTDESIMTPGDEWYHMTTTGGRHELVMPLPAEGVDLGKMAVWKFKFGDCSWWSDYRVNYYGQHGAERPVEANDQDEIDEYEEESGVTYEC
jgi:hypothetical protein